MGRNRNWRYKNSMAQLRVRRPCPLFDLWAGRYVSCKDNKITRDDLFEDYKAFVGAKTGVHENMKKKEIPDEYYLATKRRFKRRLGERAPSMGWLAQDSGYRGYMLRKAKVSRSTLPTSAEVTLRRRV